MGFKKGSLAVALLLVALMTFGGCGGGGGGDSPGPGPGPSIIDGTWKVSSISYGGSPLAVSSNPSTFPVRMIYNESAGTYTAYVNDGADVLCEDSAGTGFTVSTVDNLTRIGSSERYESDSGTLELIGGELVVTSGSVTITFARATGPGPVDPSIDGTWKFTYFYRTYSGYQEPKMGVPTKLTPETFPIKMISNGSTYTMDVNNDGEASWEYLANPNDPNNPDNLPDAGADYRTVSGLIKVGVEKYEWTDGTDKISIELTDTNTLTIITHTTLLGVEIVDTDTLTRQ